MASTSLVEGEPEEVLCCDEEEEEGHEITDPAAASPPPPPPHPPTQLTLLLTSPFPTTEITSTPLSMTTLAMEPPPPPPHQFLLLLLPPNPPASLYCLCFPRLFLHGNFILSLSNRLQQRPDGAFIIKIAANALKKEEEQGRARRRSLLQRQPRAAFHTYS
jgi:hypothetical protein